MSDTSRDAFESCFDSKDIAYVAELLTVEQIRYSLERSKYLENYHGGCVEFNLNEVLFERELQYLLRNALDVKRTSIMQSTDKNPNNLVNIQALKGQLDIVDIIGRYTRLQKAGHNFKSLCPFHSEKKPSFMVYPEKQNWHCFGACNAGGDIFQFVMQIEKCDFKQALNILSRTK